MTQDLTALISSKESWCMNGDTGFPFTNLFQLDDRLVLKSDDDAQLVFDLHFPLLDLSHATVPSMRRLLIHLKFTETVKLASIHFGAPAAAVGGSLPKTVKLYANALNVGFENLDDLTPNQTLELSPTDFAEGAITTLKFVRFQRVNHLTIFIEDNASDDEDSITALARLTINGTPVQGTNMNELKKVG